MVRRKIQLEQSAKEIFTSHGGLSLLGQAVELGHVTTQLKSLGHYRGMSHDDILKTYLGLLCTGKSDFEAAESARIDRVRVVDCRSIGSEIDRVRVVDPTHNQ